MKENQKPLFYGNPISEYGIKNGKVDYLAFSQAFEKVLNNNAFYELSKQFEYEIQGDIKENEIIECYQYYIIHFSDAAFIHKHLKDEYIFYFRDLDLYFWGVSHYGTSWDYVLTDIDIS